MSKLTAISVSPLSYIDLYAACGLDEGRYSVWFIRVPTTEVVLVPDQTYTTGATLPLDASLNPASAVELDSTIYLYNNSTSHTNSFYVFATKLAESGFPASFTGTLS